MSVSSTYTPKQFNCNGSLQDFPVTEWGVGDSTEIEVVLTSAAGVETVLTPITHYTTSALNDDFTGGFTVSTVATYDTGNTLTVRMNTPLTQESRFTEGMGALYETFEAGEDKLTRIAQQNKERIDRAITAPRSDTGLNMELPIDRALKYLAFDANKEPIASGGGPGSAEVPVSAFGETLIAAVGEAAARTILGLDTMIGAAVIQGRLTKSGANLLFSRYNGNRITINGEQYVIPSAGVTLEPTSLSENTVYFIYAYMSGSTMTLEASATGHSTDTTTGIEIKTGDATRTLVGMARTVTGPAWSDTITKRFVISWANRKHISASMAAAASITCGAGYAEFSTPLTIEMLTWADDSVDITVSGAVSTSASGSSLSIGNNSTTALDTFNRCDAIATGIPVCINLKSFFSEGYIRPTLLGSVGGGGTITIVGSGAAGTRTVISATVRG